jgi:hypothetical protein
MPISYRIDREGGILRTRCAGFVTLPEIEEHFRRLAEDPDCPERVDVVLDLREVTSLPSTSQLHSVGEAIARIRSRVRFGAGAIVASSDALYGTAKVFEVIAARGFETTEVFRGPAEAESWLEGERARRETTP